MKKNTSLGLCLRNRRRFSLSSAAPFHKFSAFALFLLILPVASADAAELKEARVSQVIKDVKLLPAQAAPRPAVVSDQVRNGSAVRTGIESRAELTFTDQTLARLGANTIFSFNEGTRNLDLGGGAMLLRVPKNAGGAQINTAAVTAAITGTTIMLEYHPNAYIKFIVLEGTGRIFRKDHVGESVLVHAGQMLIVNPKAKNLPEPVDVDLKRLMETSQLITDFGGLGSSDLIAHEIQTQLDQKSNGGLVDTNLVIFGHGTVVSLLDPTNTNTINQANSNSERQPTPTPASTPTPTPPPPTPTPTPTATPTPTPTATPTPTPTATPTPTPTATPTPTPSPTASPTPSKYGTPTAISSPVPYVISSGTTITTDPTITTNGVTDYGKIYRGPTLDGPASAWLFGATSSFDTQIGFDNFFQDPSNVPFAAFKFLSLLLTGNPTISIANGGATELALVSVGDITSGPPGGNITFSGINDLLLATQNGSITLTSDLTFQDIPFLAVYARGADSNLTFDSAVSGTSRFFLASEGNILATNSLTVSQANNGLMNGTNDILNISLNAAGNIEIGGDLSLTTEASGVTKGGEIDVTSLGDTTIGGAFNLNVFSLSGTTGTGGNILVDTGGNLTVGDLSFTLEFDVPGVTVADGANITLTVGTDLSAASLLATIDNSNGGNIVNGGNIFVSTGGDLATTSGGTAFTIQNTDGTISTGGNLTLTVGGSISTPGVFSLLVENYDFSGNFPGHIGVGGNISVTTGGDLSALSVIALVNNRSGGQIDSPVSLTLSVGGALTTLGETTDPFGFPESLSATISNRFDNTNGNPALASTVGGDATLTVNADSASIGGRLSTIISNTGSTLNGIALLNFSITDDVSIQGEADIEILNDADSASPLGGILHGSATLEVLANNFTANALFAQIDNRDAGLIDSGAVLNCDFTGSFAIPGTNPGDPDFDATVPGEADILISNQKRAVSEDSATSGGTIGGDAVIQLTATSVFTAGLLDVEIDNFSNGSGSTGGSIGGNATISLNIAGGLTTQGEAFFDIANQNNGGTSGGMIGGDAAINVNAANITTDSLVALINNSNGGVIDGNATINMNVTGTATVTGDATVEILGSDSAASAAINVNGGNYDAGGTFLTEIDGDGAITFNNVMGHADVLKVGALGTNGVLTIGGGSLSGDTTLKLYASGSNGTVNFISNVSLSSNNSVIIAGNNVTINNGVTVTITGDDGVAASVFANVPNYTGSGGNGTTSGTFAGNGATTAPLASAPPFDDPGDKSATGSATSTANNASVPTTNSTSSGDRGNVAGRIVPRGKRYVPIARVANSNELLDLADKVTSAPPEAGHSRSNAPNGRTSRGTGGVSLGKGRVLSPVLSADRASLALNRGLARPALSP